MNVVEFLGLKSREHNIIKVFAENGPNYPRFFSTKNCQFYVDTEKMRMKIIEFDQEEGNTIWHLPYHAISEVEFENQEYVK